MQKSITIEEANNLSLIFDDQEKPFFIDDGYANVYFDDDGNKIPIMINEKARKLCIETFLAFHSFEIGNPCKPNEFILLEFNGDRQVYDAMVDPEKYADHIQWIKYEDYTDNNKEELLSLKDNNENPEFTAALIRVRNTSKTKILYELAFRFKSFELYAEILLPWKIKNAEGIAKIVYLSCFQKELLFDQGLKSIFYIHKDKLEPIIIDERKQKILSEITSSAISASYDIGKDQILVLKFLNGDRDILSAHAGTIRYKYFEIIDIETLKEFEFYEKLKNINQGILIIVYKPDSDEILYYGINSKL